jgi:hypothetical protein
VVGNNFSEASRKTSRSRHQEKESYSAVANQKRSCAVIAALVKAKGVHVIFNLADVTEIGADGLGDLVFCYAFCGTVTL